MIQDDLLEVMGAVEEANSISGELDKRVKFELMLVSPQVLGKQSKKTEVFLLSFVFNIHISSHIIITLFNSTYFNLAQFYLFVF